MSDPRLVTDTALEALFAALAREGVRVLAPRRAGERVEIAPVQVPAEVAFDALQAAGSAKPSVFPRVETILEHRGTGREIELRDPVPDTQPTVLFGLRPCEARAFGPLGAILDWDTPDRFFDARREALTIVAIACTRADDACFCTSVGGAPDDAAGSDVLLRPLAGGGFAAEAVTPRGQALLDLAGAAEPLPATAAFTGLAELPPAFAAEAVATALEQQFESSVFAEQSLRCLGCGACAFACPACACFDVQDEAVPGGGRRLRCWDSCGLRQFTLHASGHNPRETQDRRWRQRLAHKFLYMPERFGTAGCVGCGKCTRACPVDMNLKEHLVALAGAR